MNSQRGPESRVLSVDGFRGVVMFLLIGGVTGIYDLLLAPRFEGTFIHSLGLQFHHAPWSGLRVLDLGQPFFMFISGVAMVFSYGKRWARGEAWKDTLFQALRRSFLLVLFGWALFHVSSAEGATKGELFDHILLQLAVAGFVAFLLLKRPLHVHVAVGLGIVLITELLWRIWLVPGFDQPFEPGKNLGSYFDMILFGQLSERHFVAISIVPAMVPVILGVVAGKIITSGSSQLDKLRTLIWVGLTGVVTGTAVSFATPVIRHLGTSSFNLLAVGLAFLSLALGYWLLDIKKYRGIWSFFFPVGMNPIFIYLFAYTGGGAWLRTIVEPFILGFSSWIGPGPARGLTDLVVWGLMWAACYWLYRRKIFFKI